MARALSNTKIESKSRKRKGVHSKKRTSKMKHSKHYKKKYRGQGK
jgi:hypothetical protein